MNPRIFELWEQSTGAAVPAEGFYSSASIFNIEKFAELIVREMCQVMKAEGQEFDLDQNFGAVQGVGRCMRKVKEHFGVEK